MNSNALTGFTPARIVALAVIGVLAIGLGYIRFAPGSGRLSVPAGAEAGDLILEPCTYQTEDGGYPADCGTLVVPENRGDPDSRLIPLPVVRIHARSGDAAEPIFRLEGGPGITNMEFAKASRFAADHDVVLVGYRGVDGSVRLDCPEVTSALKHSTDFLSEKSFAAYADGFRACADRLTRQGVDITGYSLAQQVEDFEAARVALGYGRINLLSESAGTRTALIYAWRHPESIHRSVMIAVNPPGHYLWYADATDEQLERYSDLCRADASCSERTADLAASIRDTAADSPKRWLVFPVDGDNARIASFMGLMESSTAAGPLSGPMVLDTWLGAAEGDASGLWFASLAADVGFPEAFVWGQYASAGIADAEAARDYFATGDADFLNFGRAASAFAWGGGRLADAWPESPEMAEYAQVRPSDVEMLLIGGALDFATPPQFATEELLPYLPNGHQVVIPGIGHTLSFWEEQTDAGTHLISTFFEGGEVDDSRYVPQRVDFTPSMTHRTIAKIIAGSIAGVVLLSVCSLLAMAFAVNARGHLGRKTGAILRSVLPVILGLGGWLVAAVVVLIALPGVPLDDELLAVFSVGLPIGLGVYLCWVHRDWETRNLLVGLAAAAGGALVGGWLGFNVTGGFIALITTIAGASVGANLLLIALDIVRDRSAEGMAAAAGAGRQPLERRTA